MPGPLACIWTAPFTSVTVLDMAPAPWASLSFANAISDDGKTVVGWAADYYGSFATRHRATRWTNGVLTQVANDMGSEGTYCSINGSLVVVSASSTNMRIWPSLGVEHIMNPPAGYVSSAANTTQYAHYDTLAFRTCSDSGSMVIGNIFTASSGDTCRWDSEVAMALPRPSPAYEYSQAFCCSSDGSVVFGGLNTGGQPTAAYWVGGVCRVLKNPSTNISYDGFMCNANGSAVWGLAVDDALGLVRPTYWDNLGSVTGGFYGTPHYLDRLPNTYADNCFVTYVADNPSALIAVGQNVLNTGSPKLPVRWQGTTLSVLGELAGFAGSMPSGCSPDGSIVTGWTYDASGNQFPCNWDAGGAMHLLPTIANADDSFKGKAYGISRDGSTIFGIIDTPDPPPTPPWKITSNYSTPSEGGIGDLWIDQQFVDFGNLATRRKFIKADKTWVTLGYYGELPYDSPNTYPLVWNTVHVGSDPTDFIYGWGQHGGAMGWDVVATGNDPTTDQPYPAMSLDICISVIILPTQPVMFLL